MQSSGSIKAGRQKGLRCKPITVTPSAKGLQIVEATQQEERYFTPSLLPVGPRGSAVASEGVQWLIKSRRGTCTVPGLGLLGVVVVEDKEGDRDYIDVENVDAQATIFCRDKLLNMLTAMVTKMKPCTMSKQSHKLGKA